MLLFGKVIRQIGRGVLGPREFRVKEVQGPALRPHVDFAPGHIERNITATVPGAADLIKSSTRWQVLGVWKPLKLVKRDPLIFADWRSVPDSDYLDLCRDKTHGPEKNLYVSTVKTWK